MFIKIMHLLVFTCSKSLHALIGFGCTSLLCIMVPVDALYIVIATVSTHIHRSKHAASTLLSVFFGVCVFLYTYKETKLLI